MTHPVVESETDTPFASDVTTHTSNYPATVNAGDLLMIIAGFDGITDITTPSEYARVGGLGSNHDLSTIGEMGVFVKIAEGDEGGGTINVNTSNVQQGGVKILRITGWYGDLSKIAALFYEYDDTSNFYLKPIAPRNTPQYKLDWLYINAFGKATTVAFGSMVEDGFTVLTPVGVHSSSGFAVTARYATPTNALFDAMNTNPAFGETGETQGSHWVILVPPAFTGTISGTVTLEGSPVSGASVYARNRTTNEIFGPATTNGSGDYTLPVMDTSDDYDVFVTYENGGQKYKARTAWGVTPL